jgi:MerR family transcriptional regulator, light-induced transcriptional regulator
MGYRIKTVASLTGVPRTTLLAWERRYSIVAPERLSNGYRAYSDADVALLSAVKVLVDEGLKVSEAVSRVREQGRKVSPELETRGPSGPTRLRESLMAQLLAFDRSGALEQLARTPHFSYRVLLSSVYEPLLVELGEGWEAGRYTIAQEHFASGFCREQIQGMLVALDLGPSHGPRVVLAGFPGDTHELPLLIVATHLALRGQRVTWLGADVPAEDLASAVVSALASLVCVSVVLRRTVGVVEHYCRALRLALPEDTRLVVGGPGLPRGLPSVPGVEVCHDIDKLVL